MRRMLLLAVAGIAVVFVVAGAARPAGSVQPSRWVTRDLGTLPGVQASEAVAINESGQVIGTYRRTVKAADGTPYGRAFLWENGRMRDLGTLGGRQSQVVAINAKGQIVGWSETKAGSRHAFLWENGRMRDLGTLFGGFSEAVEINDQGQVVGLSDTKTKGGKIRHGVRHAFLWRNGRMRDLGTLGGAGIVGPYGPPGSKALAINEYGQVVGGSRTTKTDESHAFLWQDGKITDLGKPEEWLDSWATAVNNQGQIVGGGGAEDWFLWENGKMSSLATLPGTMNPQPVAINESGEVVVRCDTYQRTPCAFLWQHGKRTNLGGWASAINDRGQVVGSNKHAFLWQTGKMTDLGTLPGWEGSKATAINSHDQIIGIGYSTPKTGQPIIHAVLWTLRSG